VVGATTKKAEREISRLNAVLQPVYPPDKKRSIELQRIRDALDLELEGAAIKAYIAEDFAMHGASSPVFSNTNGYSTLSDYIL
jgi:hypothetical protein